MFSSTQTHPPTRAFTNLTHHTILPTQCRHLSHITTIPFHHLFHSIITHHSTPSTATNNMGCNSSPKYSQSTPLHHSVTNGLTVHTVATDITPLRPSLEHAYNPLQHQFQSSGNHQQQGTHSAPANTMPTGNYAGCTHQLSTNQYTRNVTEIQIRIPHVELPIFTGGT
jgi:hypothetical protein